MKISWPDQDQSQALARYVEVAPKDAPYCPPRRRARPPDLVVLALACLLSTGLLWLALKPRSYTLQEIDSMRWSEHILQFGSLESGLPLPLTMEQHAQIEDAVRTAMAANVDPRKLVGEADRRKAYLIEMARNNADLVEALRAGRK